MSSSLDTDFERNCGACPDRLERTCELIVDEPVPQNLEELAELVWSMSATADRRAIVHVLVPQIASWSEFLKGSVNRSLSNCQVVVFLCCS